jgi:hypothetical protein
MFHLSPSSERENILRVGLLCGLPSNWNESFADRVYLFVSREDALAWNEHCLEQGLDWLAPFDIWSVDTDGLSLVDDPYEPDGYTSRAYLGNIDPSRLKLIKS